MTRSVRSWRELCLGFFAHPSPRHVSRQPRHEGPGLHHQGLTQRQLWQEGPWLLRKGYHRSRRGTRDKAATRGVAHFAALREQSCGMSRGGCHKSLCLSCFLFCLPPGCFCCTLEGHSRALNQRHGSELRNARFHKKTWICVMGHGASDESARWVMMLARVRSGVWWSRGGCSCGE